MGLLNSIKRVFGPAERKYSTLELWREIYGGRESSSGILINRESAMQVSTVLACVRVRADGLSQVPWRVYQKTPEGSRVAEDHPLNNLIYRQPNAWQTSFEFRETLNFHLDLAGNAYIFVNRVGRDREARELRIIEPGRVEVKRDKKNRLTYKVKNDTGDYQVFPAETIWHIRGPSWNGWQGMDPIAMARDAIGLAASLERSHNEMHKNGAATTGLLSVNDTIGPEQYEFLAKWLARYEIGGDRYQKPMLLDRGATYTPFTMSGADSQHLETRKFQIEEICRFYRVMPIMVGYSDKTATYASAEQMFLAHVVHCLMPIYERIEQSADIQLLSDRDRSEGYYTKFTPNALMRGAAKDRAEFYAKALGSGGSKGWMTQNDVRALEELNKHPDPAADELPQPAAPGENTGAEPSEE